MTVLKELFKNFEERFEIVKKVIGDYIEFRDDEAYSNLNNLVELTNEAVVKAINNKDYENKIFEIRGAVVDLKEAFDKVRYARRRTDKMLKAFEVALRNAIKVFNDIVVESEDVVESSSCTTDSHCKVEAISTSLVDEVGSSISRASRGRNKLKLFDFDVVTNEYETNMGYTAFGYEARFSKYFSVDGFQFNLRVKIEVIEGVVVGFNAYVNNEAIKSIAYDIKHLDERALAFKKTSLVVDDLYTAYNTWFSALNSEDFIYSIGNILSKLETYNSFTCMYNDNEYILTNLSA